MQIHLVSIGGEKSSNIEPKIKGNKIWRLAQFLGAMRGIALGFFYSLIQMINANKGFKTNDLPYFFIGGVWLLNIMLVTNESETSF